jgi:AraC-like DNA-binding protein
MALESPAPEWVKFAAADGGGVELLHAHYTRHVYERHTHEGYAIGVTEEGVQAFNCRGRRHASTAGLIMAFNPDEPHDGHAPTPEGFTYRMLYLAPGVVESALEDACGRRVVLPFFPVPLIRDTAVAHLVAGAHRALSERFPTLEREARVREMIVALATRHAGHRVRRTRGNERAVRRVRELLHASLADDLSSDDLARAAGISRFHLSRLFRDACGLPPHAYHMQLRLTEAKRLLAAGERPPEVAASLGFVDQSHLSKRFKGAFGITPGAFARAAAIGNAAPPGREWS